MMKREILISGTQREIRVAILEDDQLVELQVDRPEARRMVGDIYLGKVEAVLPGIQAAFVDIGTEKSAFLHSSDLVYDEGGDDDDDDDADDGDDVADAEGDRAQDVAAEGNGDSPYADAPADGRGGRQGKGDGKGDGKGGVPPRGRRGGGRRRRAEPPPIQDVLKRGQTIIVQVSKEPISTKGPRVTAQVSLAGRFLVFMPFASRVGVSRKIGDRSERSRLREQVQKVLPKDSGGVIVRQVTVQNPSTGLVNTANVAILTTSDGNTSNAVVSTSKLANLTATGKFQDLTIASPYNLTTALTGDVVQAMFVYVSATGLPASGTVDVRVYGDIVNF